jgi:hypothetical protein
VQQRPRETGVTKMAHCKDRSVVGVPEVHKVDANIYSGLNTERAVFDSLPRRTRRDILPPARDVRLRAVLKARKARQRQQRAVREVEEIRERDLLRALD